MGSLDLLYIEGGKPRTARKELKDLLVNMSGTVKVSDPYYGVRSLESLEFFPVSCQVRFLTCRTNESPQRLAGPIRDFKREHPNTQLRVYPNPNELHDRYVLSRDKLLIVGHGLKDIGGRQSFVIAIGRALSPDLMSQLGREFNSRWSSETPLSKSYCSQRLIFQVRILLRYVSLMSGPDNEKRPVSLEAEPNGHRSVQIPLTIQIL